MATSYFGSKATSPLAETGTLTNKTTSSNDYADVGVFGCILYKTKVFQFAVTTNTLKIKVLGSYDGGVTYPADAVAEFVQTVGSIAKTVTDPFTHLKVQAAPNVAATHGTVATSYFGTYVG